MTEITGNGDPFAKMYLEAMRSGDLEAAANIDRMREDYYATGRMPASNDSVPATGAGKSKEHSIRPVAIGGLRARTNK